MARKRRSPVGAGLRVVHIQLDDALVKQIDHLAIDADKDRGEVTAALIRIGLKHSREVEEVT